MPMPKHCKQYFLRKFPIIFFTTKCDHHRFVWKNVDGMSVQLTHKPIKREKEKEMAVKYFTLDF